MNKNRVIAKANRVRGSARKARIPADVVRGMMVEEALAILEYMPKKAAADVYKVVHSAKANAVHNYNMDPEKLKIDKIQVGESMRLRRIKPKSRGMASVIQKHFCNISVELVEKGAEDKGEKENKKDAGKKTPKAKTENKKEENSKTKSSKKETKAKETVEKSAKATK